MLRSHPLVHPRPDASGRIGPAAAADGQRASAPGEAFWYECAVGEATSSSSGRPAPEREAWAIASALGDALERAWNTNDLDLALRTLSPTFRNELHRLVSSGDYVGRQAYAESSWRMREFFPRLVFRPFEVMPPPFALYRVVMSDDRGNEVPMVVVVEIVEDDAGLTVRLDDGRHRTVAFAWSAAYDEERRDQALERYSDLIRNVGTPPPPEGGT